MQRLDEARRILKTHGWLLETPEAFADALLARCVLRSAVRGEMLTRVGIPPEGLYGIAFGACSVEIAPHERGPNIVHLARPGAWFGEAALFGGRGGIGNIAATRTSDYLFVPCAEFEAIAGVMPEAWRWLGMLGYRHFEIAVSIADDSTRRSAGQRIAAALLRLGGVRRPDSELDPQPEIDVTQYELAHMATVSRATVVAHLDRLERSGLITRAYGRVTLLRPTALREWVETPD